MKLQNVDQLHEFLKIIDDCKGDVFLTSAYGDKYNLKSKLSQYIAVAALLGEHGDELEIFCEDKEDELKIVGYLMQHKEIL